jgi:hypothetical protein
MAPGRDGWRMASPLIDPRERKIVMRNRYWKFQNFLSGVIVVALVALAVILDGWPW